MSERIAIKDLQKTDPGSELVTLYEIALNASGTSRAYFTSGLKSNLGSVQMYDYDDNTQTNTYTAIPILGEEFEFDSGGPAPRPGLTIANVTSDFSDALGGLSYDDLIGKKVYRRRTLAKYLKGGSGDPGSGYTPIEFPRQIWIIDLVGEETPVSVSFELATPFDVDQIRLPGRVIANNKCWWIYAGASPHLSEQSRVGGCNWHREGKMRRTSNGVVYTVYVNEDDEYIVPSSLTFTDYDAAAGSTSFTINSYISTSAGTKQRVNEDGSFTGVTETDYWQVATTGTKTALGTPSSSNANFKQVRVYSTYSSPSTTTYSAYTDDRYNSYVNYTDSGVTFLWKAKRSQNTAAGSFSYTAPAFNQYWSRGDVCGKRLTSCSKRFGFDPITPADSTSTGKAKQRTTVTLPFGGFPGARKYS